MTHITLVPVEIITRIVELVYPKNFYECALVNKLVYKVVNPLLWQTIEINNTNASTRFIVCLKSAHHPHSGRHVQSLFIYPILNELALAFLARNLPSLKKLKFFNARHVTDECILLFSQFCPRIKSLSIFDGTHLTSEILLVLHRRFPNLASLALMHCPGIGLLEGAAFRSLKSCAGLRELTLTLGDQPGVVHNAGSVLQLAMSLVQLDHLQILRLYHCPPPFSATLFMILASGDLAWPQLTELWIEGCGGVDEAHLTTFLKAHPPLVHLALIDGRMTDHVLDTIAASLPMIQGLDFSDAASLTAQGIRRLIRACPHLRTLTVLRCGIRGSAFPEADDTCLDYHGGSPRMMASLDEQALVKIRQQGISTIS